MEGQALARIDSRAGDRMERIKTLLEKCGLPLWMGLLGICFGIVLTYAASVGWGLSSDSSDWGNFGSLLSGTFGALASFTALGTLFIVLLQLRTQEEITKKQIESIEFDKYERHRRIFFERLEGVENLHGGKFTIYNKEGLYQKIFPHNSPLRCDIEVPFLEPGEESLGDITDIKMSFDKIAPGLRGSKLLDSGYINQLIDIQLSLMLRVEGDIEIGDISFAGNRTMLNIYRLRESIRILEEVFSTILEYAGHSKIDLAQRAAMPYLVYMRDIVRLSNEIKKKTNALSLLHIETPNDALSVYEEIYLLLTDETRNPNIKEQKLRKLLYRVFRNSDNLVKYTSDINKINEIRSALNKILNDDHLNQDEKETIIEWEKKLSLTVLFIKQA